MFTHIMVGSNDVPKSVAFYDATFGVLGVPKIFEAEGRCFYGGQGGAFGVVRPANGEPACFANGGTIGLSAKDAATVDAWHAAGLANGGSDEGAPGVRENAPDQAYGAYLRDPAGNKLCAFGPNPNKAA